ncbi:ubiquinol-cytochrome c reductase iron-sulfur subunit [candidate division KSB1 bacterium]
MSDGSRRDFMSYILGFGIAAVSGSVFYPVAKFMTPPAVSEAESLIILAGNINDLGPGSSKTFRFGSKPGLLIRTDSGDFHAFIAVCTHLGCIVQYSKERNGIWCACHGGLFDNYGNVVAGPAPKALEKLDLMTKGDEIFVSRAI